MSSVKCIGAMATLGAVAYGGVTLYNGLKGRKQAVKQAEAIANNHGGRIPIGGMTKDGALWDGFTTVNDVKKKTGRAVAVATTVSAIAGAIGTGLVAGLTLLAKAKLK